MNRTVLEEDLNEIEHLSVAEHRYRRWVAKNTQLSRLHFVDSPVSVDKTSQLSSALSISEPVAAITKRLCKRLETLIGE